MKLLQRLQKRYFITVTKIMYCIYRLALRTVFQWIIEVDWLRRLHLVWFITMWSFGDSYRWVFLEQFSYHHWLSGVLGIFTEGRSPANLSVKSYSGWGNEEVDSVTCWVMRWWNCKKCFHSMISFLNAD